MHHASAVSGRRSRVQSHTGVSGWAHCLLGQECVTTDSQHWSWGLLSPQDQGHMLPEPPKCQVASQVHPKQPSRRRAVHMQSAGARTSYPLLEQASAGVPASPGRAAAAAGSAGAGSVPASPARATAAAGSAGAGSDPASPGRAAAVAGSAGAGSVPASPARATPAAGSARLGATGSGTPVAAASLRSSSITRAVSCCSNPARARIGRPRPARTTRAPSRATAPVAPPSWR